jgi:peptidoglycan/xylan/chitin deacetylase (PgdA/CDA1 family)
LLGRSRAVVLYYHRIGTADVLTKPAVEFGRDLKYLKRRYRCVSLAELCEKIRANVPLRRRSVVITFDDGYRDNFLEAAPLLKAARLPATFFVATGFIGTDRDFAHDLRDAAPNGEGGRYPKLQWDDLKAMQAGGFEIAAHTVNHTNLGAAGQDVVELEVTASLAALNYQLGVRPRAFSFPWGKPDDISTAAVLAVKQAGYYAAASAYGGANGRGSDLFDIRRVDVGNGNLGRLAFKARVAGFDPDYVKLRLRSWLSRR